MSEAVLRLKVVLADTEPPIWRRVEVPADTTLRQLHAVIQAAMGWDDDHLHQFHRGRDTLPGRLSLDELAARGVKTSSGSTKISAGSPTAGNAPPRRAARKKTGVFTERLQPRSWRLKCSRPTTR